MHAQDALILDGGAPESDVSWTDDNARYQGDLWLLVIGAMLSLGATDVAFLLITSFRHLNWWLTDAGIKMDLDE